MYVNGYCAGNGKFAGLFINQQLFEAVIKHLNKGNITSEQAYKMFASLRNDNLTSTLENTLIILKACEHTNI